MPTRRGDDISSGGISDIVSISDGCSGGRPHGEPIDESDADSGGYDDRKSACESEAAGAAAAAGGGVAREETTIAELLSEVAIGSAAADGALTGIATTELVEPMPAAASRDRKSASERALAESTAEGAETADEAAARSALRQTQREKAV